MGRPCDVKVQRTNQVWCAELDAPYSHIWIYESASPIEALRKLLQHRGMLECYRQKIETVISKYMAYEIESLSCVDVTNY